MDYLPYLPYLPGNQPAVIRYKVPYDEASRICTRTKVGTPRKVGPHDSTLVLAHARLDVFTVRDGYSTPRTDASYWVIGGRYWARRQNNGLTSTEGTVDTVATE